MENKSGWLPIGFAEQVKKNRLDRDDLLKACRAARNIANKHKQHIISSILEKAIKKAEKKNL